MGLQKLRFSHTNRGSNYLTPWWSNFRWAQVFCPHPIAKELRWSENLISKVQAQKANQQYKRNPKNICFVLTHGYHVKWKYKYTGKRLRSLLQKGRVDMKKISLNVTSLTNKTWMSIGKLTENNLGAKRIYYFSYLWKGISWVGCFV